MLVKTRKILQASCIGCHAWFNIPASENDEESRLSCFDECGCLNNFDDDFDWEVSNIQDEIAKLHFNNNVGKLLEYICENYESEITNDYHSKVSDVEKESYTRCATCKFIKKYTHVEEYHDLFRTTTYPITKLRSIEEVDKFIENNKEYFHEFKPNWRDRVIQFFKDNPDGFIDFG